MNAKKRRKKNQRRARKLAEQAWEAADDDHFDLAVKMIRRAVDLNPGSPVLWNDQGLFLFRVGHDEQAAASFEAAITLAGDFAEAYANLGLVRVRQGKAEQAVILQRQAVRHAPRSKQHRQTLSAYEALIGQESRDDIDAPACSTRCQIDESVTDDPIRAEFLPLASRIDGVRWSNIYEQLIHHGFAHLPELLSPEHCESLRRMFDDDSTFSKSVTMAKSRFGRGVYRYFASPIPAEVEQIRRWVYPHVAEIANAWQRLLGEDTLYPLEWEVFRRRCFDAGQDSPSPIMLRYERGGFNAFHQDIRGEVFFPLQLLVVLSERGESLTGEGATFSGGNFLFADAPQRRSGTPHEIPAGLGDAVIFCTRDRLVRVGGLYGLTPVKHGMARITSGTRYALGLPFHEYE